MSLYGFGRPDRLDREYSLPVDSLIWSTTSPYHDRAENHCSSVLALNLLVYRFHLLGKELSREERDSYFWKIYAKIGKGPVAFLAGKLRRLFPILSGIDLKTRRVNGIYNLKETLHEEKAVVLLLRSGWLNWHWVLCIGYGEKLEEGKEEIYLKIADGWQPDPNYFRLNGRGKLWSMTAYEFVDR